MKKKELEGNISRMEAELADMREKLVDCDKWKASDIKVGMIVESDYSSKTVIIPLGWSRKGVQRFYLGGLNGQPLEPFSNNGASGEGFTAQELADYFNDASNRVCVGNLTTNFKEIN